MSNKRQSTKTVHAVKSPYSEPSWPVISHQVETELLDHLLPLLTPIGQQREKHTSKPKGKRRRKKHKERLKVDKAIEERNVREPSRPQYLTVGFNSTVRYLELLSQRARLAQGPHQDEGNIQPAPIAVFVCTSKLPAVMTAPLPLLARTASLCNPGDTSIRLIPISQVGASRLAQALSQPRVNMLGILPGIPGMEELDTLIRDKIESIDVPWIRESVSPRYQPVKIHSEETVVSQSRSNNGKRKREAEDAS